MKDEDLEESVGVFFLDQHQTRCQLCEEGLFKRSLYHQCVDDETCRLDLHFCDDCNGIIYRVGNIRADFPEELSCGCEGE